MRISQELRNRVVELDRRYRSTWDAHAIAHVLGMSPTTAAKILREVRGPRPKRVERAHTRRTRFTRRDVMWSSDFVRVGWGWLLLKTMDEMSGFVLGWDLVRSEDSLDVLEHAESIIKRLGRAPLVWKFDHGSAFMSEVFLGMVLEEHEIVPYPTQRRAPWTNGRVERDHQEILNWLIPLAGRELTKMELEREIDDGMLTRNYVKPRACLGFRKSAEVYFSEDAVLDAADEARGWLAREICEAKAELEDPDPEQIYEIRKSGERMHRRAVRTALQRSGHYVEWDTAETEGPPEAETVNKTRSENVSF
jgi:transposase InsO family protein